VTQRFIIRAPDTADLWSAYLDCRYRCLYEPFNLPRSCTTSELDSPGTPEGGRANILHRAAIAPPGAAPIGVIATARLDLQPDHPKGRSSQLRYFSVDPAARGLGVGQALLRHIEDEARAGGAEHLWMEARVAALNFYLREGYADIGEGPLKWGVIPHRLLEKAL
jgi:GNAT superfamily N-acetyltransferase